jgi:Domain of unknown function (DUF4279)
VALEWPPELMRSALDVGITPVYYIAYDRPSQPEPEPYASFNVAGTFEPDEMTRRLGVFPSEAARAGDTLDEKGHYKRKNSLWTLRSRVQSGNIDEHVSDVLDQLDNNKSAFGEVSCELGGIIEIVGFSRDYAPAISLGKNTIRRLALYDLRLDVEPEARRGT